MRAFEKDSSAVSLRDVARCCELLGWFATKIVPREARAKAKVSPLAASMVLALAFVYFYRLPTRAARAGYWEAMLKALVYQQFGRRDKFGESGFGGFAAEGAFERVIAGVQKRLCANVEVEDGVAMNAALSENLFVGIVAILNRRVGPPHPRETPLSPSCIHHPRLRLPLFIVGKPGTSKTLTLQVIASNLQGAQSPRPFFRSFPVVHLFTYQCSPLSSSDAIQRQFDMACRCAKPHHPQPPPGVTA